MGRVAVYLLRCLRRSWESENGQHPASFVHSELLFIHTIQADWGFAAYVFRRVVVENLGRLEWFIGGGSINSYGIVCSIAIPPLAVGRSVSLINEL